MIQFPLLESVGALPRPADPERAARGVEQWRERAAQSGESELVSYAAELAADARGARLLEAIFGNSPFLGQCLLQEIGFARELLSRAPEDTHARLIANTESEAAKLTTPRLMASLRRARRREALLVAIADIGGLWNLRQVTGALSDFAEAALRLATRHLLAEAATAGELELANGEAPEQGSGFAVLAMGKLGTRELNYSSDIDLMVLYDQDVIDYRGEATPQECFARLTQGLVRILGERTKDGYVFRTDLRLRPDGGATPLAMSMIAAEGYYESVGQNWERAAMIKARAVAGDIAAGAAFLERIAPFIWRKHLDFAAIQDIHSIKRQIHDLRGHARVAARGHNIKLGRGGIREIEFFAQTQQLIAGGRDRRLRTPDTCGAIRALAHSGRLDEGVANELIEAYQFLRRLEHRLQMIGDEQTHTLPESEHGLSALATFLGYQRASDFSDELLGHLKRVQHHYAALFEDAPPLGHAGSLAFTGTEDDPETLETLSAMGFKEPHVVAAALRKWHHGRYRAMRSARARELLTELTPALLEALSRTANADAAFVKFDEFLHRLPAGVQLFSLFHANPEVLDLLAEIMGGAPRLATHLSRHPTLLDGVLSPGFFESLPLAPALAEDLSAALEAAGDYEDMLDITRRWTADHQFQVGVQVMRGISEASAAGPALTNIAEVLIRSLKPWVEDEFARRHGRVKGGAFAVVGLGKLGGREMAPGSDLDLIFIYDCRPEIERSDGAKPLPTGQYYARLSQRFIAALTALTGEGRLYEVDMRLRPSGTAGPIAASLQAFESYHLESAWTWEHMALTRARVISGPPALAAAIRRVVKETLTRPRDAGKLVADVADMRLRVAREHSATEPWDVKYVRGGLMDLEFICQYLQLRHAPARPQVLDCNTGAAFRRLAKARALPGKAAEELIACTGLMQNLQGLLRLCCEGPFAEDTAPEGLRRALARAGGTGDFSALTKQLRKAQARGYRHFQRLVETPARAFSSTASEQSTQ